MSATASSDFAKYLRDLVGKFPSKGAMARAIGIKPSRLSHALKGGSYTFNVENCLRLASAAHLPPGEVLRAAGKTDVAELLEHLFPDAGRPQVTADQRAILDHFASLSKSERDAFRVLIFHRVRQARSSGR